MSNRKLWLTVVAVAVFAVVVGATLLAEYRRAAQAPEAPSSVQPLAEPAQPPAVAAPAPKPEPLSEGQQIARRALSAGKPIEISHEEAEMLRDEWSRPVMGKTWGIGEMSGTVVGDIGRYYLHEDGKRLRSAKPGEEITHHAMLSVPYDAAKPCELGVERREPCKNCP